ncbi:MAG TPA: hypothetical protein VGB83_02155 [Actinomycetota bacterium]
MSSSRGPIDLIHELFRRAPSYAAIRSDAENDLVYEVFGDLALLIVDKDPRLAREDVGAVFDLFNEMADSAHLEEQNVLVVAVLEVLCDRASSRRFASRLLRGNGLALLERVSKGWPDEDSEKSR